MKKGFTLIELLVVIAIIGILAAIVFVRLDTVRAKGRDAKRISDIGQLQIAFEAYFEAHNAYPATLSFALVTEGFIPAIPTDPSGGGYYYSGLIDVNGLCKNYHLGVNLEQTNEVLAGDADAPASQTACSGGRNFSGSDTTKCNGSSGGRCFDKRR